MSDASDSAPRPVLPPRLAALQSQVGAHRYGRKVLVYGPYKTGKSYLLSTAPGPILVAACGEDGISQYLKKDRGDVCIQITSPEDLMEFMKFAKANERFFKTVGVDNADLLWSEWMDAWQAKLNVEEIQAGHWRKIKADWKVFLFGMNRSPFHFIQTAGVKDLRYETEGRSIKGIHEQDVPAAEKSIPRVADWIFKTDVVRDKLMRPTEWHTLRFVGGRRPKSIPASELYTGREWKFSSKQDNDVWGAVMAPLDAMWSDGAVDYLGVDPQEAMQAEGEIRLTGEDEIVGRLMRLIKDCPPTEYTAKFFGEQIQPELVGASKSVQERVKLAHESKKKEIKG